MSVAEVRLWGRTIGAVAWDEEKDYAHFEYDPIFAKSGIEVSPLMMPLSSRIYSFPSLHSKTFHGLPGMLADSLPDKFGHALIDVWLAKEGRTPESFNPVERLCYVGQRGIGALEFAPMHAFEDEVTDQVDIEALTQLASDVLTKRNALKDSFDLPKRNQALQNILQVGTSAGGARAKAVVAWNPETEEVRSGQVESGSGFSYWILKFDGVSGNKDKELDDPDGYGLIEYAYYKMALAAGIQMHECRLLSENGRNHFMTKRFDRTERGGKIHMQSLGGLAHYDFNQAGAYSYEQAIQVIRKIQLSMADIEQQFRRAAFNIIARNQDDHVKNIAFLMNKSGEWKLSPAFDMIYSYNPSGSWTHQHQMSLNGKRDHFTTEDFIEFARTASMNVNHAKHILEEVIQAVQGWLKFAKEAGVPMETARRIKSAHRKL